MSQKVEHYSLEYKRHLYQSENFVDARRLRDHYTTVEGICYPNTKSKTYNTKYKKFMSKSEARRRKLEDLAKHLKEKHESKKRPEVDNGFKKLVESKKWILSTGTIVEDKLYSFGKTCFSNHPSQSLILDLNDLDIYVKSEVFTPQGIEEIKTYHARKVRDVLNETQEWEKSYDRSKSFDLDWIKHSIYTLLREYEYDAFEIDHNEQCGETCSVASSIRKDNKRDIRDVEEGLRKQMGYRCDLLIRQHGPTNEINMEYCASEVGMKNKELGRKEIREKFSKLPKLLKDMLDTLTVQRNLENTKDIYTYGIICSGLSLQVLHAERIGYVTRIIRNKRLSISRSISKFGESIIPILVQAYILKLQVADIHDLLNSSSTKTRQDESWLDTCLFETDSFVIIPQTSLST
ncbi:hypothetical protein INT46_010415 [Mucor plumbeus]|uniref:Uncharacterized protein n=1 Tax=Mucor plumbeus TaxID=97098 RepID=A0A8H7UTS7_9FUNG|nr:hypothetical protein INT46_010415 [Mucor plumbeus]